MRELPWIIIALAAVLLIVIGIKNIILWVIILLALAALAISWDAHHVHQISHYTSGAQLSIKATVDQLASQFLSGKSASSVAAIGIIQGDQMAAYGYSQQGNPSPTGDSVFLTDSVQKVFGGVLLGHAIDVNLVTLDESIANFVPAYTGPTITLEQLADFTSGLPAHDKQVSAALQTARTTADVNDIIAQFLSRARPTTTPGTTYLYNDITAPMAANFAARAMGESYQDAVASFLFEPLGMVNTGQGFTSTAGLIRGSGHKDPTANTLSLTGAPQSHSTINDLNRFIHACLYSDGDDAISHAISIAQQPYFTIKPGHESGLFWTITNGDIYFKNGFSGTYGYSTMIIYDMTKKCGVSIMTNTRDHKGVDKMGHTILSAL